MAEAPKLTPEQQRPLEEIPDAILACDAAAAKTAAEQVLAAGGAVARRLVAAQEAAHA